MVQTSRLWTNLKMRKEKSSSTDVGEFPAIVYRSDDVRTLSDYQGHEFRTPTTTVVDLHQVPPPPGRLISATIG